MTEAAFLEPGLELATFFSRGLRQVERDGSPTPIPGLCPFGGRIDIVDGDVFAVFCEICHPRCRFPRIVPYDPAFISHRFDTFIEVSTRSPSRGEVESRFGVGERFEDIGAKEGNNIEESP